LTEKTKTSSTFCNNWLAAFIDVGPVTAIGCGEPGIDRLSIRGSGWFYSGYSGFHPFKRDKKRKERKKKRIKREKKREKY